MESGDRKKIGALGEGIAALFLERKGFLVTGKNYRKPWGEIDLIAERNGSVHFVEVKSFSCEKLPDFSHETDGYRPEEQVHQAKLKKIARTAELYMNQRGDQRDYQIDVVGVFLDIKNRRARCRLFEQVL